MLSSSICRDCGLCCHNTEMELSLEDIKRIEQNNPFNWRREDFSFFSHGFFQLRNVDQHCVFLNPDSNYCVIYPYRPMGCRFYPLIYDISKNKCSYDSDCPHLVDFPKINKIKGYCTILKNWVQTELLNTKKTKSK